MAKSKVVYVCSKCGAESPKWMGQCPSCHEWNTLEEREKITAPPAGAHQAASGSRLRLAPKQLAKVSLSGSDRMKTGLDELDRVLGGGFVKDSITIIAAKPGAGKSTLLLQLSQKIAAAGGKVLYVSGDESDSQIRSRAARILPEGIHDNIWVMSTAHMNEVVTAVEQIDPVMLILDSIQTFYLDEYPSRPGSPTQVMECTEAVLRIAKNPEHPRAVLMAGQLTKEDELAGVRSLEHMVDTVLFMEADPVEEIRTVSATKNRFGSTGETGFFTMEEDGLNPISNPSRYFMTDRAEGAAVTGCALTVLKEGTRPMVVEVESLISNSFTPYPSRIAECMSRDQLGTLLSVLEIRGGIGLYDKNVVVKSTGGLKMTSPSVSLGILMAIASSVLKISIPQQTIFIGDVGLTGELKKVPSIEMMIREVCRLGFKKIYIPAGEYRSETFRDQGSTQILRMRDLSSVIRDVFGDYRKHLLDEPDGGSDGGSGGYGRDHRRSGSYGRKV
ncbi:MAG: DNA repair protein RadA [Firmicutes bacterium]|nr:DNA repair protein RadA [Bacillota bacterium]